MDGRMTTPVADIAIGHKFIQLISGSSLICCLLAFAYLIELDNEMIVYLIELTDSGRIFLIDFYS